MTIYNQELENLAIAANEVVLTLQSRANTGIPLTQRDQELLQKLPHIITITGGVENAS